MPAVSSWTNAERPSSSVPSDVVSVAAIVAPVPSGRPRTSAMERGASVAAGVGEGVGAGVGGAVAVGLAVGLTVGLTLGLAVGLGDAPGPGVGGAARFCGAGTAWSTKSAALSFVSAPLPAAPPGNRSMLDPAL